MSIFNLKGRPKGKKSKAKVAEMNKDQKSTTTRKLIFVTGCLGAPIRETAERIAACKGWPVQDLDQMIEEKDGRSIARICQMAGEHAYRNAEFEAVKELCQGQPDGPKNGTEATGDSRDDQDQVVLCGDGILYDEDTREMILQHELVIVGQGLTPQQLWERAKKDKASWHAFLWFGSDQQKQEAFLKYHQRQVELFASIPQTAQSK